MVIPLKSVGPVIVFLLSTGFLTGCSELEGLRIANRRQAITIRDQLYEIENLTGSLERERGSKGAKEQCPESDKEKCP
ncbi:MAG: hypothetical protein MRK01_16695 [Candidatus Scalindua sp.]|nr:hypothetical protein [Candidatus Scalindua sp.]